MAIGIANIASAAPHRILVVDDEEIVLVALNETLRRERYEVVTVSNPMVALEVLRKETFSVILIDHEMPLLTGLELLAQAKEIQPDTPRILITAVLSLDTVINAINKGEVFRFIVKPWLREELLMTVKNAVQRYELMRKNTQLQARSQSTADELAKVKLSLDEHVVIAARKDRQIADLNRSLEQNLQRTAELSLHTLETFYAPLGTQTRRVVRICRAMSDFLGLVPEERRLLETSAYLYDTGLLRVPRDIIKRWQEDPNKLSAEERTLIERHPMISEELAALTQQPQGVGALIRAHHERFDGRGFPLGLAGEDIPWLSRILTVAAAFASCSGDTQSAMDELKSGSGTKYDPKAVDVFLRTWPRTAAVRREREVFLTDLRPGMILAKGIYTANGLVLVTEGQELDSSKIEVLRHHNTKHPLDQSFTVYC